MTTDIKTLERARAWANSPDGKASIDAMRAEVAQLNRRLAPLQRANLATIPKPATPAPIHDAKGE